MHLLDHQNNEAEADRIEGRINSSTRVLGASVPHPTLNNEQSKQTENSKEIREL